MMKTVVAHSELVDGLSDSKLQFSSRYFICTNGSYRCSEYTVETPINLAHVIKIWTVLLGSLVFLNGILKEMTLLFICIYVTIFIVSVMKIYTCVIKESLLIEMEVIGMQQTTFYWFGWKATEILNREDIVDVIINEAVTMGQVIFYLTVVMKDKSLKPLFVHSKPRLYCIQKIYKEIQEILQRQRL